MQPMHHLDLKIKIAVELAGFDVDIINAICKEEGIEADVQNLNFDALLPALQSNTIDIAISDMTISRRTRARDL